MIAREAELAMPADRLCEGFDYFATNWSDAIGMFQPLLILLAPQDRPFSFGLAKPKLKILRTAGVQQDGTDLQVQRLVQPIRNGKSIAAPM